MEAPHGRMLVVLVHGLGGWPDRLEALRRRIAKDHDVDVFTPGSISGPKTLLPVKALAESVADEVIAFILEQPRGWYQSISFVGISLGGVVAVQAAPIVRRRFAPSELTFTSLTTVSSPLCGVYCKQPKYVLDLLRTLILLVIVRPLLFVLSPWLRTSIGDLISGEDTSERLQECTRLFGRCATIGFIRGVDMMVPEYSALLHPSELLTLPSFRTDQPGKISVVARYRSTHSWDIVALEIPCPFWWRWLVHDLVRDHRGVCVIHSDSNYHPWFQVQPPKMPLSLAKVLPPSWWWDAHHWMLDFVATECQSTKRTD